MSENAETSISLTRTIEAPIEILFAAWTDPALLEQWQAETVSFEPFEGGSFRFETADDDEPGRAHVVSGTVLKFETDRLLVERWSYLEDDGTTEDSVLTVSFRKIDDARTEITLIEDAAAHADPESRIFSIEAWDAALNELAELLE